MLIHQADLLLAHYDSFAQASIGGAFKAAGKAILWVLVIIFLGGAVVGLLLGYFVGRTVGRKQGSPSHDGSVDQFAG